MEVDRFAAALIARLQHVLTPMSMDVAVEVRLSPAADLVASVLARPPGAPLELLIDADGDCVLHFDGYSLELRSESEADLLEDCVAFVEQFAPRSVLPRHRRSAKVIWIGVNGQRRSLSCRRRVDPLGEGA